MASSRRKARAVISGAAPVAGHDVRARGDDLADVPGRQLGAVGGEDQHGRAGQRQPGRAGTLGVLVRRHDRDALALGLAELADHLGAAGRLPASWAMVASGRAAPVLVNSRTGAAGVGVTGGERGDHGGQRRDDRHDGRADLAHPLQQPQVRLGVGEHDLAAADGGHQDLVEAVVPGHREPAEDDVVAAVAEDFLDRASGEGDLAVRADHALRRGGAAGGVDENGDVVFAHLDGCSALLASAPSSTSVQKGLNSSEGEHQHGFGVGHDGVEVELLHRRVDAARTPRRGAKCRRRARRARDRWAAARRRGRRARPRGARAPRRRRGSTRRAPRRSTHRRGRGPPTPRPRRPPRRRAENGPRNRSRLPLLEGSPCRAEDSPPTLRKLAAPTCGSTPLTAPNHPPGPGHAKAVVSGKQCSNPVSHSRPLRETAQTGAGARRSAARAARVLRSILRLEFSGNSSTCR